VTVVVDANVFLRSLIKPKKPGIAWMHEAAKDLFRQADRGAAVLTTTDAVVAEVAFILTARTHYGLTAEDACARLVPLLAIRNLRFAGKQQVLRALEIWSNQPRMGFVDALVAAYAESPGHTLASFDRGFDRMAEPVARHMWPNDPGSTTTNT
jgi:predicted nucleic acid-binding protein